MRRIRGAAAVALLAFAAAATAAHAHGGGGTDYTSEIRAVRPADTGLTVDVLDRDDRLALRNDSGKTVVVEGYNGEPYAFDWAVPIRVGDRPASVAGTLTWVGRPDDSFPLAAAIALAAVALGGLALIVVVRRRRRGEAGAESAEKDREAW